MIHIVTKEDLREIGKRIKLAQKMAGLSGPDMANLMGISEIQYSKILRGISMVTEDKFLILNRELGVSLDFLFTGYERDGKLLPKENGEMTEIEFKIFSNEIALYVSQLPLEMKKEKMMEMIYMFQKLFGTL